MNQLVQNAQHVSGLRRAKAELVVVSVMSGVFILTAHAQSQDDPPPVSTALETLTQANESAVPFADRVATTVFREDGTFSSVAHTVRWQLTDESRLLAFEIDAFRFFAEPGYIEGAYASEVGARTVLIHENEGKSSEAMLADAVPLGPMPQFWARRDDGTVNDPALGLIRFADASKEGDDWLLIGGSPAGTVAVVIDTESGRVRSLEAQLRDGTISQQMYAIDAGTPSSWRVMTAGRRVVQRLDQLVPAAPPLAPGTLIPDWPLRRIAGEGVSLDDWFAEQASAGPWRLVLLCQRGEPAEAAAMISDAAERIAAAASARLDDAGVIERFWLRHIPLCIVVIGSEPVPWSSFELAPTDLPLVFSTQPDQTIDRVQPTESVVAIAVDTDRVIGAIVKLDDDDSIAQLLDAMQTPANRTE